MYIPVWIVEMKSTAADKYKTTYDDLLGNTNLLGIGNIQRDNLLFSPLSRLPYVFDCLCCSKFVCWNLTLQSVLLGIEHSERYWDLHANLLQLCPTLCIPIDYSMLGSSVHGILYARILEWVAIPFFKGFSNPGIEPVSLMSPALAGGSLTTSATAEV